MYVENTKIDVDSITLSADTVINSTAWATVTNTIPIGNVATTTTSTATITIDGSLTPIKNQSALKTIYARVNALGSKPEKEKIIDQRLIKIDQEIAELREKTWFYSIKEYVPNKVYGFVFHTIAKQEYKTICADEDTFDLEFAFFLAYAKYLNHNQLTPEGYVNIARTLSYNKRNIKRVKNGIKLFHKLQERDAIEEQIKAEKKHRHDKFVQKKIEKRNRKKDEQIQIIKTAIEASKQKI